VIGTLDDLYVHLRHYFRYGAAKQRTLIAAIGVEFHQQALRIDENMPLLALDLLSRVVARRINRSPPFSALLTLWLSITAAVGLASRPIASRHFT
jgi:hypothetical protein